jgi:uncharacterized membrane protein YvlD (DUF360 family)
VHVLCADTRLAGTGRQRPAPVLTSVVAGALKLPFHITGFVPAFLGAIIVGVVGWLLNVLIKEEKR